MLAKLHALSKVGSEGKLNPLSFIATESVGDNTVEIYLGV